MVRVSVGRSVLVALLAGQLLGGGCAVIDQSAGPATVYIGADLPLTGAASAAGRVHDQALELRVEQVNEQQAAGGADYRLELRVRDNRSDPVASAGNLAELAADPEVVAIITAGCPQCVSEADLSVATISLDAADVLVGATAPQQLFRLGPEAGANADRLSVAMTEAGASDVGLVTDTGPYAVASAAALGEAAGRDGITIAIHERVGDDGEDTVAAAAGRLAAWQPDPPPPPLFGQPPEPAAGLDAVVVWAGASLSAQVAAALREAGFDGPLFLDMIAADDLFLTGAATAFDGATLVGFEAPVIDQMITASPAAAARQDWFSAYLSRYDTYHVHASWAADAVNVLADALDRAGTADRTAVRDELERTRLDGFTGLIRFTAAQHSGLHPSSLLLLRATGGRWYPHLG